MREFGFTLLELVVVIVVIGILSTIAIVKYQDLTKQASQSNDIANAKEIQSAILIYFSKKVAKDPKYTIAGAVNDYNKNPSSFFNNGKIPKKRDGSLFKVNSQNGTIIIK